VVAVDLIWLKERGHLHDAHIVAVVENGEALALTIDDEWANENDAADAARPGLLVFSSPTNPSGALPIGDDAGWIFEALLEEPGGIRFNFCNGYSVLVRASAVEWLSSLDP